MEGKVVCTHCGAMTRQLCVCGPGGLRHAARWAISAMIGEALHRFAPQDPEGSPLSLAIDPRIGALQVDELQAFDRHIEQKKS